MKLLNEIIENVITDDVRLAVVLRKCRVLAAELGNDPLKDWVLRELNGYEDKDELPDYRRLDIVAKGFFVGPLGAQINDQPLVASVLKPEHRWWATTGYLLQGVAAFEALVAGDDAGSLLQWWPGDLVARYQSSFFPGYTLNRAWQEIPTASVVALLDTVRNRILEFGLDLKESSPNERIEEIPPERVEAAVTTIIYGGSNIIAAHLSGAVQQVQVNVREGDFASLAKVLEKLGVPTQEVAALRAAIQDDSADSKEQGFGERTRAWLGKAVTYVGKGGAKVTGQVATATLTQAVAAYFGLSS